MYRIEIVSTDVTTFEGTSKTSGKAFKIRKQAAYLHTGKHYPEAFEITLGRDSSGVDQPAYPIGFYQLTPASIGVNPNTKGLEIKAFDTKLVREPETAKLGAVAAAAR